jgi:hypothetical protein
MVMGIWSALRIGIGLVVLVAMISGSATSAQDLVGGAGGAIKGLPETPLKAEEIDILRKFGFVVTQETRKDVHEFYVIPGGAGGRLPAFVTVDVILHAYGALCEDVLREQEKAYAGMMKEWQESLWTEVYVRGRHTGGKQDAVVVCGLVAVGRKLMDPLWRVPDEGLPGWVMEETAQVQAAEGPHYSKAWDRLIDYRMFKPRGLYTRSPEMENYFRARTWWSRLRFRFDNDREMTVAACLADAVLLDSRYQTLAYCYRQLLGGSDSADLRDLYEAAGQAARKSGDAAETPESRWKEIARILAHKFQPAVRVGSKSPQLDSDETPGVSVFPPAKVFDNDVFAIVTDEAILRRHVPGGLDVMAALGNETAESALLNREGPEVREPLRAAIGRAKESLASNMNISALQSMTNDVWQSLSNPENDGQHPAFMRTDAYRRKSLQTVLAGWAEHRHRWILHMDVVAVGGRELLPPGFVEPNLRFWDCLLRLTVGTRAVFGNSTVEASKRWDDLEMIILTCRHLAEKQLKHKPFTRQDREFFDTLGDRLANLEGFGGAASRVERPRAIVADVCRVLDPTRVVHAGTGMPQAIYVVMPQDGEQWLCRGGVMTYREYVTGDGRVLTDDDWQKMLLSDSPPAQPEWTKDFCRQPNVDLIGVMRRGKSGDGNLGKSGDTILIFH